MAGIVEGQGTESGLSIVCEDDVPKVLNEGSINQLAKRFGELAPRLDIFEVNDNLVYYNHRRDRRPMTGRVFRSWCFLWNRYHCSFYIPMRCGL